MQEVFLHHVWRFQKFASLQLFTSNHESIQVLKVGTYNTHAGADFQDAHIIIGDVEWVGSVEIHLKASDWEQHAHQHDTAYQNVILHFVWDNDRLILRKDGTPIPTLVGKDIIAQGLWHKYQQLFQSSHSMPCVESFGQVERIKKLMMLDKALMNRLERKAQDILQLLSEKKLDWEEVAYLSLAKNFGFHVNAEPFMRLAKYLPIKIIQKHRNSLFQIEALIFGIAGFLEEDPIDEYQKKLKSEFKFLAQKYQLEQGVIKQHEWKFMRMRPANFPTVRLAQFATLLYHNINLFSLFIHFEEKKTLIHLLKIEQSDYWRTHYVFGKTATTQVPTLGLNSIENMLINTIVPLMASYATYRKEADFMDKAITLLESMSAETNTIITHWQRIGLPIQTAFDSQGAIEWYNNYCSAQKCLECHVGLAILKE